MFEWEKNVFEKRKRKNRNDFFWIKKKNWKLYKNVENKKKFKCLKTCECWKKKKMKRKKKILKNLINEEIWKNWNVCVVNKLCWKIKITKLKKKRGKKNKKK